MPGDSPPTIDKDSPAVISDPSDNSREGLKEMIREKARGSKRLSWLLDECIRIPGTDIRFGLDPIIGLLPFGGETIATLFGALLLGDASRKGVPFRTLIRMVGNMLLNAFVGIIPGLGDLFSVWFKSNSRNYQMLTEFLNSEEGHQAKGGWWPFLIIIVAVALILLLNLVAWILLFKLFNTFDFLIIREG